ncbi:APC family permease [Modestobacter sp. SYSU DS0875]
MTDPSLRAQLFRRRPVPTADDDAGGEGQLARRIGPLGAARTSVAASSSWPGIVLAAGAVVSIFSVAMYGQTRILFAMSRDRMVPALVSRVDPRTLTPLCGTVAVAVSVAALAGFLPRDVLVDPTSMGTLVAFSVVSVGLVVLRRTRPDLPRGSRVPGHPVVPVLSVAFCLYLIAGLPATTWLLSAGWLTIAAVLYVTYARTHSALRTTTR